MQKLPQNTIFSPQLAFLCTPTRASVVVFLDNYYITKHVCITVRFRTCHALRLSLSVVIDMTLLSSGREILPDAFFA